MSHDVISIILVNATTLLKLQRSGIECYDLSFVIDSIYGVDE